MKDVVNSSEFTNISNAHHLALIEQALAIDLEPDKKANLLENASISLKTVATNIVYSELSRKIDLNSVETSYNKLKAQLSESEATAIKEELLKGTVVAHMVKDENVDNLLSYQGKYLKYVLFDNDLKDLTKQLFWSEYDRLYGSNLMHFINREKVLEIILNIKSIFDDNYLRWKDEI